MALSLEQQAIEQISRAKRILIVTREHATPDALASLSALFAFLQKQNISVDLIAPGIDTENIPSFLPHKDQIKSDIGAMRAFSIRVDVSHAPLADLAYDVQGDQLTVTLTPKHGEWTPKDISFRHGDDRYDLVIAVDAPDLASLGSLIREHADFFYRTPIITIDRDPTHEHWGHINLVDLTAVSTTEVLFGMFERWNRHMIDESVATALLAGMIAKTQSFRTANVTPKTLESASKLIAMGARREEIVHGLWRTRSVPILKLWGKALSRLEIDRECGLVWSTLTREDFIEAGAHDTALEGIINELVSYAPEAKVVALFYETQHAPTTGACVTIHATPPLSATEIGRPFGATGSREHVEFCLKPGASLQEGVDYVVNNLRATLRAYPKK